MDLQSGVLKVAWPYSECARLAGVENLTRLLLFSDTLKSPIQRKSPSPDPIYPKLRPEFSNNFSFKCHRRDSNPNTKDQALVYAVNDISFHPVHGTFSTSGTFLWILRSFSS